MRNTDHQTCVVQVPATCRIMASQHVTWQPANIPPKLDVIRMEINFTDQLPDQLLGREDNKIKGFSNN